MLMQVYQKVGSCAFDSNREMWVRFSDSLSFVALSSHVESLYRLNTTKNIELKDGKNFHLQIKLLCASPKKLKSKTRRLEAKIDISRGQRDDCPPYRKCFKYQ